MNKEQIKKDNIKNYYKNKIKNKIIITNYHNEIKDNNDLLREVSKNGHEWYIKYGTTQSNVDILKNILNIDLII